ncbi:unnamed protein product [Prunus brigantina]
MVQLEARGDSCRWYIVERVTPNMPCEIDIILGLVSGVHQGVIIMDSWGIFGGSARCYYKVEKLLLGQPRGVVHRADITRRHHSFAHNADVRLTTLREELAISVPMRDIFMASAVYMNSLVLVGDVFLEVDLIPLDIVDINIILGMD